MKLYKHKNYDEYYKAQILKNKHKLKTIYVKGDEIVLLTRHIKKNILDPKFGICHGVRNGWEVQQLRKRLGVKVIGTEISPTATKFPHTIEWDFHKIKDEWVDNIDFIYSNSFDHSYKPEMCLDQWMRCIKKSGICYIHWHGGVAGVDSADCFAAAESEIRDFFNKKYKVIDKFVGKIGARPIFAIKHR